MALVALVALAVIAGYGFYAFRSQDIVSEIKEAHRKQEKVLEDQLTYQKRLAEVDANRREIEARGGDITPSVPVINIQHTYVVTNSHEDVAHPGGTNPTPPQASSPTTVTVTNYVTVIAPPATVVVQPAIQMHYSLDRGHWSGGYRY